MGRLPTCRYGTTMVPICVDGRKIAQMTDRVTDDQVRKTLGPQYQQGAAALETRMLDQASQDRCQSRRVAGLATRARRSKPK